MSPLSVSLTSVQTLLAITLLLVILPTNNRPHILAQLQPYQLSLQPQTLQPQIQQQQQQQRAPTTDIIKSPCPHAIRMNTMKFRGSLHFICLQATNGWPRLDVIHYAQQEIILTMSVTETETDQLASFVDEMGNLRILLATPNRVNGTSMYSIDSEGKFINETHTINSQYVSALSIWRMELTWEWHLAIANQPSYEFAIHYNTTPAGHNYRKKQQQQIPDLRPIISIFTWRSTYFDSYQSLTLPEDSRVNKLEPMHINGQEFLIVALESSRASDYPSASRSGLDQLSAAADSLIYKLDFGDGSLKWAHYQDLYTQVAFDVKSFVITHQGSLQRDYYIALIGQAKQDPMAGGIYLENEPNNMAANDQASNHRFGGFLDNNSSAASGQVLPYGLVIYKYFGDKFRRTEHSLPAPGAIKLDTITYGSGDSYVIIALLLSGGAGSNQVNLYLFDGLRLNPMPGPFGRPPTPALNYPPAPISGHPYYRQRRTMENSANIHLFLSPPDATPTNDTTPTGAQQKRTLADETSVPPLRLPALALSATGGLASQSGDAHNYDTTTTTTNRTNGDYSDSVYHIPINEMIKEFDLEQEQIQLDSSLQQKPAQDSGYSKRNFFGSENLLAWCNARVKELLVDNFDKISRKLLALPRVDQATPIELKGHLIIEDNLHVSNLLYVNRIEEKRVPPQQNSILETPPSFHSATFDLIQQARGQIRDIERQVKRILVDDGSNQEIFRPLAFEHLIVECLTPANFDPRLMHVSHGAGPACPHIDNILTRSLNSRDISNITRQALLTNRPMEIRSDVRFEHLILRDHVEIRDTLNGIPIEDIVFKRGPPGGPIVGHKNFMRGLYSASRLSVSEWDGAVVDRSNFLTSDGDQRIEVDLRFAELIIDSPPGVGQVNMTPSSRIEKLNGIHLDTHLEQIAVADENNVFEAPLYVDELILNGPIKLTENSRLCQIDLENLWLNTMFKQSNQNISGHMQFLGNVHISYGGDILVEGSINGIDFRPGTIMMRSGNYNLMNPIIFDDDVNIRDLTLNKTLNGIQVIPNHETGQKELAILYNGGTQQITGDKVFHEVHLGGNSNIHGNINGDLNITDLHRMAHIRNTEPHRFNKLTLRGKNISVANGVDIHIGGYINDILVDDLCALANQYAKSRLITHKRLTFSDQPIRFKSLRCGSINGFNNLTGSFMTRHGNQFVAGTLRLVNGAIFNTSLSIRSRLNNMPVGTLAGAIGQTVNETRTRHKDVRGDLILDELIVDRINDLSLSRVFLVRSEEPQFVKAPWVFEQLNMENLLVVGKNLLTNSFNNLNITDIFTNTLHYDTPQIVYNHVQATNLQLLPNSSLSTKSFNGYDLQRLYADSVLMDVPQQILAPKTFRRPVEFSDLVGLRHGINELTAEEFRLNLLLNSEELIEGDVEFTNDVIVKKKLEIQSGLINDVDINLFKDSMLYESLGKPMRIDNGSVRFKDVKVNDLVVAGKIQGIDLSREALLKNDNLNGSYDAKLRELQISINNQRLLNSHYGPGSSFRVSSTYRGADRHGTCYVHSCSPRNNNFPPSFPPHRPQRPHLGTTALLPPSMFPQPDGYDVHPLTQQPQIGPFMRPPIKYIQQFYPNILPERPQSLMVNNTHFVEPQSWTPIWDITVGTHPHSMNYYTFGDPLIDSRLLEHKSMLKVHAIADLAHRINGYLSISFFYEIIQKHPLLGPLLHAARNPIINEHAGNLLLLKGTSKLGEPCLKRGQTVAVMAQQRHRNTMTATFTQSSLIRGISNPTLVESIVVDQGRNYLFLLDSSPEGGADMISHVIIYLWDNTSGMYELKERIVLDGYPTAMRAFTLNNKQLACIALANPKVITQSNHTGAPLLYCQRGPLSEFSLKISMPLWNVFDMDIVVLPNSMQIVMAALSQQRTEQIGDLSVGVYDVAAQTWTKIALRRMVRPMKLHFFRHFLRPLTLKLVVSEAITSNDDPQALTRIFSLRMLAAGFGGIGRMHANASRFYETQIIRDNQFYDIQSVHLDDRHSMLFLQSAHSISIYAPSGDDYTSTSTNYQLDECDDQYSLVQRLPTKGANKFLVFNNHMHGDDRYVNQTTRSSPFLDHFLVLSKDDCEQQQYATLILKAKFK